MLPINKEYIVCKYSHFYVIESFQTKTKNWQIVDGYFIPRFLKWGLYCNHLACASKCETIQMRKTGLIVAYNIL